MWIIIYSCSFNRVKARPSALWYSKSSSRSRREPSEAETQRGAQLSEASRNGPPRDVLVGLLLPHRIWLLVDGLQLCPLPPRPWQPGDPACRPRRPGCSEPPRGPTRTGARTRQHLDVRAGGRRWSPLQEGVSWGGGGTAGRASSAECWGWSRGSGRLNRSGRRRVGGSRGPQRLCPGSGVEGAGLGVLASGLSWGLPGHAVSGGRGLTLGDRRALPLDRHSHHSCHLGSRDLLSPSQVAEKFCLGVAKTCASPTLGVCWVCRDSPGAPRSRLGCWGALGQPGGEMLPGGHFLRPFPGDREHIPAASMPSLSPGNRSWLLLKFQCLALRMVPRTEEERRAVWVLRAYRLARAESVLVGTKSFSLGFHCVLDGGSLTRGYLYFGVRIPRNNKDLLARLRALQTPSWVQSWRRETLKRDRGV